MSADPREHFRKKLAELRPKYQLQLAADAAKLEELARDLRERNDMASLRALHRLFHSLAGSGSTFGFHEVSRRANELEKLVSPHLAAGAPPLEEVGEVVRRTALVVEVARAASETEGGDSVPPSYSSSGQPEERQEAGDDPPR